MATESSAVVRFIDLVQRQSQPIADSSAQEPPAFGPSPVPGRTEIVRRRPRRRIGRLVLGALLLAGGAAGAGIYVGQKGGTSPAPAPGSPSPAAAAPVAAVAPTAVERPSPDRAAPIAVPPPAVAEPPRPAPAAVGAPVAAEEPPPAAAALPAVASDGGFDLRVNPTGARISLDGKAIGVAPLRVKHLAAGRHTLDIEAPSGYFSKHVEIDIPAGERVVLGYELEATDTPAAPIAPRAEAPASAAPTARSRRALGRPKAAAAEAPRAAARVQPRAATAERAVARTGAIGTLKIGSKPPCDIVIDGKKTGLTTPQTAIELAAGTHSVVLANAAHGIKKKFKVKIAAGENTRVVLDLLDDPDQ